MCRDTPETLWRSAPARYQIPTFIFVNKMDQAGTDPEKVLTELQDRLSEGCTAFPGSAGLTEGNARVAVSESEWLESMAMLEETAMEEYLETDTLSADTIRRLIRSKTSVSMLFWFCFKTGRNRSFSSGTGSCIRNHRFIRMCLARESIRYPEIRQATG